MRNILLPYSANLISLRSVLTLRNVVTPNSIFYQRLLIREMGLWLTSKDHLFKCPNRSSKQQNKGGQSWNLNYPNVDSRYLKALQSINFQILRFHFLPPTCTDWFCQKVQILKTGYYLVRIFMQSLPTLSNLLSPKFHYTLFLNLWKKLHFNSYRSSHTPILYQNQARHVFFTSFIFKPNPNIGKIELLIRSVRSFDQNEMRGE